MESFLKAFLFKSILITTLLLRLTTSTTVLPDAVIPNTTEHNQTEMHRITQPSQSQSQSQQINLKLPPLLNISAHTDVSKVKEFRPSPQLSENYEYNKFPVVPAMPEAKTFGTVEKIAIYSTIPENTNDVWTTRIRFPGTNHQQQPPPVTVNDHPYPFTKDVDKSHYSTGVKIHSQQNGDYGGFGSGNKYDFGGGGSKYSYGDAWDKTLKQPKPAKSFYGDDAGGHTDLLGGMGGGLNPWKKIIKMLAAVIPIGLLISALTPSVITITPANGTSSYKSQARNLGGNIYGLNLLSKLANKNCDERIFCELLLSAEESKNTDKDIEVLLDNFLQKNGNSEKLDRIYKAIRNGNCTTLQCDTIPNN